MSWWNDRLVGFDCETTGVNPDEDRIVTATVAWVGGGQETIIRNWLADPGVEISEGATEVHGISTERARAEGRNAATVVAEVLVELAQAIESGFPLVPFNARFDLTMIDREARRYGLPSLPELIKEAGRPLRVVDPLVVDKHLDKYRKGSRKLVAICETYGVQLDTAHESESDAVAAARAAWVLGAKGKIIRRDHRADWAREKEQLIRHWEAVRGDLDRLHNAQVEWAAEQARSLRQYFIEKGEPHEGVREEWPWVPPNAQVELGVEA